MSTTLSATCQCGKTSIPLPPSLSAPVRTYLCHCTQCQRQSASAFGITCIFPAPPSFPAFPPPELSISKFPTLKSWERKTESGRTMRCFFCGECGSRLVHVREGVGGWSIKGGCIRIVDGGNGEEVSLGMKREWLEGAEQIWVKEARVPRAWLENSGGKCWEGEPDD